MLNQSPGNQAGSENQSTYYPISKQGKNWITGFLVLLLLAYLVPFTFLTKVQSFYGAFLFWCVFALLSIICVGIITGFWRDLD